MHPSASSLSDTYQTHQNITELTGDALKAKTLTEDPPW